MTLFPTMREWSMVTVSALILASSGIRDAARADEPILTKSRSGLVGVLKKLDAKKALVTFIVVDNGGTASDLTYPLVKGATAVQEGKKPKQIKLADIEPGTKIHVYVNQEKDGSGGRQVMEIRVPVFGRQATDEFPGGK
jgi:hypothetical protein